MARAERLLVARGTRECDISMHPNLRARTSPTASHHMHPFAVHPNPHAMQGEPVINAYANTCGRQASCIKLEASSDCTEIRDARGWGDVCKVGARGCVCSRVSCPVWARG